MARLLIIGAGGVGSVVAHKCVEASEVFTSICLASRRLEKCNAIRDFLNGTIETAEVDADNFDELVTLMRIFRPDLVIHVALPYQDLTIMDACLECGVHYIDTANYEPRNEARFCYQWQWDYHKRFQAAGLIALLGSGFDPGVTNVFCAYALKHHFDTIEEVDIIDCNAGDHGLPFATNFNPEINIREITAVGKFFENGEWIETDPLSINRSFDFPGGIGPKKVYLLYHEELESLAKNLPGIKRLRFWMTFSDNYLTHLRVLENVGITGIEPIEFEGHQIVPIQFLKALLPDPGSLGPLTKGLTCIGCLIRGRKNGELKTAYIYNLCDHQVAYHETGSQAISYTTGVPAAVGAMMLAKGLWEGAGVFNMEEFDPDPFLEELAQRGLPWTVVEGEKGVPSLIDESDV